MTQHPPTREVSYSCTAGVLPDPNKSEAGHIESHCSLAHWSCPSAQLQKEKTPSQAAVHLCAKPFLIFQAASLCLPSGSLYIPPMPNSRVFKQCSRPLAPVPYCFVLSPGKWHLQPCRVPQLLQRCPEPGSLPALLPSTALLSPAGAPPAILLCGT